MWNIITQLYNNPVAYLDMFSPSINYHCKSTVTRGFWPALSLLFTSRARRLRAEMLTLILNVSFDYTSWWAALIQPQTTNEKNQTETDISIRANKKSVSNHWPEPATNLQWSPGGWLPSRDGCLVGQKMAAKGPVPARSHDCNTGHDQRGALLSCIWRAEVRLASPPYWMGLSHSQGFTRTSSLCPYFVQEPAQITRIYRFKRRTEQ